MNVLAQKCYLSAEWKLNISRRAVNYIMALCKHRFKIYNANISVI